MDQGVLQERPLFQRLVRELTRCGWRELPLELLEGELFFQTFQGGRSAPCHRLQNQQGRRLLIIGLEQVILPSQDELFPRFLNLPLETRMALSVARLLGEPDWVLLITTGCIELYRLPEEMNEFRVHSMYEFEEEFMPSLAALAQGHEEAIFQSPNHLPEAESLRGWLRHWTMQLASALKVDSAAIERMLWKWILMLQLARRTEGSELLGGWGLSCERHGGHWTVAYNAVSATDDLCKALETFDRHFSTRLFPREAPKNIAWLRQIEETALADQLRAELLMQAQSRFEPETVAWMFTDLLREQEGWRREVAGMDPIRQRFSHEGWNIFRPLTCDISRYGLTAALRDADRLAQYFADLNRFLRQHRPAEEGALFSQPDLFCQHPRGISLKGELEDGVNFLYGEALRLAGVEPERHFGIGLTFLLKALALCGKMDWPFAGLGTLDQLFV